MRAKDFLNEGRDAPLYHAVDFVKARNIFHNDMMPATWAHYVPQLGKLKGNSFTRNKRFVFHNVVIKFDQAKLASTHKIVPLDANRVYYQGYNDAKAAAGHYVTPPEYRRYDRQHNDRDQMMEEFVIGDIKNLHRYIVSINVVSVEDFEEHELQVFWNVFSRYVSKFNIPYNKNYDIESGLDWAKRLGVRHKYKLNPEPIPDTPTDNHVEKMFKQSGKEDEYIKTLQKKKFDQAQLTDSLEEYNL
jgi:hypothetical protein